MRIHVYGKPREVTEGFEDYLDPSKTAVISSTCIAGISIPRPTVPARRLAPAMSSNRSTPSTIGSGPMACQSSTCDPCCVEGERTT